MNTYLDLTAENQRIYCEQAQSRLGLPAASIEKDFWVCWTLRELFNLPKWGNLLTFKGGTSLSKGWKLIERFSEDIDIVINRDFLGFGGEASPREAASRKQIRKRLDQLKKTCQHRIQEELRPRLRTRMEQMLADFHWQLESDVDDPDHQSLLFRYPGVFPEGYATYVNPVVRIELGARSDIQPAETIRIEPYLADAFPDLMGESGFSVRALSAKRTFWEKAMLLHEETLRPADKRRMPRLARHYYDLWCMIQRGVADEAAGDLDLFREVAEHRSINRSAYPQ